ncbi:Serine/threonine-protein phosphatase 4 regulatory subunit 4 [Porphyridium purpureum]|uniref:Serine/threonine-protein phosphatase 4 regulatory subunit 4 n=1 Tax=Porphyridium purpureum TaxID=35688 RepID=A0A5J4YPJ3_PORPP|nr:Serine/threonine-protein phosphatase 4 regulatory subunit 4 [Porphyridium purpureum]|eukprot:POR1876..scf296_7
MAEPMDEEQHIVLLSDDVLTSVPNATMVLMEGPDVEKLAVLYQFPQFLEHCPEESIETMIPEICRDVIKWNARLQMASAEALYHAVHMKLPEAIAKRISVGALRVIQTIGPGDVFDAFGEILSMILPQLLREDVLQLIVPATKERAASDRVESRRLAARIIGSLVDKLNASEIEEQFLDQTLALLKDPDASVRAMIAQSLVQVASALPLATCEKYFLTALLDMFKHDPDARVKASCLRALARSAEAHKERAADADSQANPNGFFSVVVPLFLEECENASKVASSDLRTIDDDTYLLLEIFAEVYGYFVVAVGNVLKLDDQQQYFEQWTTVLNSLRRMVTCNGPTVRQWCAFNLPAVVLTCAHRRPDRIKGVLTALSTDTDVETRGTLANGVHEIIKVLSNHELLRKEAITALCALVNDSNNHVRISAIKNLALDLEHLSRSDSSINVAPYEASRQLEPIFSNLETISQDSWRSQEILSQQLGKCARLCAQEILCNNVAPVLFQIARASTYLVRKAGMHALVEVVRYIPDIRRRDHIMKHFRTQWAQGKVYWTRLAFIESAFRAIEIFSTQLFHELFAEELFAMVRDPVPNVRLRLLELLRQMVPAWRDSRPYLDAVKYLQAHDKDPQVHEEATQVIKLIEESKGATEELRAADAAKEEAERAFFVRKTKKDKSEAPIKPLPDVERPASVPAGSKALGAGKPMQERQKSFGNSKEPALQGAHSVPTTKTTLTGGSGNLTQAAQVALQQQQQQQKNQTFHVGPMPPATAQKEPVQTPPQKKVGGCCVIS